MNQMLHSAVVVRETRRYSLKRQAKRDSTVGEVCDRNLLAFFEAIVAEGVLELSSPDELKTDRK